MVRDFPVFLPSFLPSHTPEDGSEMSDVQRTSSTKLHSLVFLSESFKASESS